MESWPSVVSFPIRRIEEVGYVARTGQRRRSGEPLGRATRTPRMGSVDIVAATMIARSTMELSADLSSTVYGRDDELLRMREALASSTERGRGSVMLIGGEAGIGKTTLLHDLSRLAVERGMVVLN